MLPPLPPPPPPRPKMPFTYVVNIYSHMSLSKGHVGSRGGGKASLNKLKDTSFIFPMTNVILLGVFRKHAQKEYGKVWETKSIPILSLCYSLEYYMTVKPTDQPAFSVSKLKERLHMLFWVYICQNTILLEINWCSSNVRACTWQCILHWHH